MSNACYIQEKNKKILFCFEGGQQLQYKYCFDQVFLFFAIV